MDYYTIPAPSPWPRPVNLILEEPILSDPQDSKPDGLMVNIPYLVILLTGVIMLHQSAKS